MSLQPLMSRAWSCQTLKDGLSSVYAHHERLVNGDLDEAEMREELRVS